MNQFVGFVENAGDFITFGVDHGQRRSPLWLQQAHSRMVSSSGRLMQGIAICWGISTATYADRHIRVDILYEARRTGMRRLFDILAYTINWAFMTLFGAAMTFKVFDILSAGEISNELRFPDLDRIHVRVVWGLSQRRYCDHPLVAGRVQHRSSASESGQCLTRTLVAIVGCIAVLVLMLIRVPIAVSLGSVSLARVCLSGRAGAGVRHPDRLADPHGDEFQFQRYPDVHPDGQHRGCVGHEPRTFSRRQCVARAPAGRHGHRDDLCVRRVRRDQRLVYRRRRDHDPGRTAGDAPRRLRRRSRCGHRCGRRHAGHHDPAVGSVRPLLHSDRN